MIGWRKPRRNALYKWFNLPWGQDSFPESFHVVCSHVLLINTYFASVSLWDSFLQSWWAGALSLAAVPGGLVTRIQHCHHSGWTSVSGWRTEILLQATAGWATLGQVHVLSVLFQWILSCGCIVVFRVKPWWIFTYCPFCSSFKVEHRFKFKYRKITNFIRKLDPTECKGYTDVKRVNVHFSWVCLLPSVTIGREVPFYM